MATKILNKQRITSLKPKTAVFEVMDGAERGLGVRVSPTAKKVWIYRYRMAPTPNERAAAIKPRNTHAAGACRA